MKLELFDFKFRFECMFVRLLEAVVAGFSFDWQMIPCLCGVPHVRVRDELWIWVHNPAAVVPHDTVKEFPTVAAIY